jgi:hypothetical protein
LAYDVRKDRWNRNDEKLFRGDGKCFSSPVTEPDEKERRDSRTKEDPKERSSNLLAGFEI